MDKCKQLINEDIQIPVDSIWFHGSGFNSDNIPTTKLRKPSVLFPFYVTNDIEFAKLHMPEAGLGDGTMYVVFLSEKVNAFDLTSKKELARLDLPKWLRFSLERMPEIFGAIHGEVEENPYSGDEIKRQNDEWIGRLGSKHDFIPGVRCGNEYYMASLIYRQIKDFGYNAVFTKEWGENDTLVLFDIECIKYVSNLNRPLSAPECEQFMEDLKKLGKNKFSKAEIEQVLVSLRLKKTTPRTWNEYRIMQSSYAPPDKGGAFDVKNWLNSEMDAIKVIIFSRFFREKTAGGKNLSKIDSRSFKLLFLKAVDYLAYEERLICRIYDTAFGPFDSRRDIKKAQMVQRIFDKQVEAVQPKFASVKSPEKFIEKARAEFENVLRACLSRCRGLAAKGK